jgi:hypothetical protein
VNICKVTIEHNGKERIIRVGVSKVDKAPRAALHKYKSQTDPYSRVMADPTVKKVEVV